MNRTTAFNQIATNIHFLFLLLGQSPLTLEHRALPQAEARLKRYLVSWWCWPGAVTLPLPPGPITIGPQPGWSPSKGHSSLNAQTEGRICPLTSCPLSLRVLASTPGQYFWEAWSASEQCLQASWLLGHSAVSHAYLFKTVRNSLCSHCPSKGMCLTSRGKLPCVLSGKGSWEWKLFID